MLETGTVPVDAALILSLALIRTLTLSPLLMQWVSDTLVGTPGAGADPELARADFQITIAEHLAAARFPPCAAGEALCRRCAVACSACGSR